MSDKVSANETIVLMLHNINIDKKDLFYKSVENYCNSLSPSGNVGYRIKRLLNEKPKVFTNLSELSANLRTLIIQQQIKPESVYLNNKAKVFIDGLLNEWGKSDLFKFHNLGIRNKILLHGPTGNGKTTIAKHISQLANLPFVEVNSDMIIDSHVGNTSANIYNIFNKITQPCVLFWDEVDSIGRLRGRGNDSAAGMENERMVNSILINLEKLSNDVIFIGATNRIDVLDSAFLRRFDVQFEIDSPSKEQGELFADQLIEYYKIPKERKPDINGLESYSSIKLKVVEAVRNYILEVS